MWGPRRAQERLLHEIVGVIGGVGEPASQPDQALIVNIEQGREPFGARVVLASDRRRHRDGLPGHASLDVRKV